MAKLVVILPIVLFAAGCSRNPSDQLARLSDEFVHTTLAFSPAMATSVGLHQYQGQNLDNLLDDTSPENLDRQRRYYEHFRERLNALDASRLTFPRETRLITKHILSGRWIAPGTALRRSG